MARVEINGVRKKAFLQFPALVIILVLTPLASATFIIGNSPSNDSFTGSMANPYLVSGRTLSEQEISAAYSAALLLISQDNWSFSAQVTDLELGSYYYNATATDSSNNSNSTETRILTIIESSGQDEVGGDETPIVPSTCEKAWSCGEWSACADGVQTRECSCGCSKDSQCTGAHETQQTCDACEGIICVDDGNPCTSVACANGICVTTPLTGKSCDDGDICTKGDTCSDGVCTPGNYVCDCQSASDCPTPECFTAECIAGACEFTYDETCGNEEKCEEDWSCGSWSDCEGGLKTRECSCSCENGKCQGDSQMVEKCEINTTDKALDIVLEGGELVGDDVSVTVVDDNGNEVKDATIQFITPEGIIVSYEDGFKAYERGKWAVMADKSGYAGDYELFDVDELNGKEPEGEGALASVSQTISDFVNWIAESASRSVLLLVAVIIAAVLIVVFASKTKKSMKPEKI